VPLRFRLTDPATQQPQSNLQDVTVLYYPSSGGRRNETPARHIGDGIYEADLQLRRPQAYYVYVASRSKQMPYGKLPYLSLIGVRNTAPRTTKAAGKE
jgi:hypothetical protein